MFKLYDLKPDSLEKAKLGLAKWKKTYATIFKIVDKIHKQVIEYRKQSKNENEFVKNANLLKQSYKKVYEHSFIDFFIQHYTSKIPESNQIFLNLDIDLTNPYLHYPSTKFETDAIGFNLRNGVYSTDEIDKLVENDLFQKFLNILSENKDVEHWFKLLLVGFHNSFVLQMKEMEKLFKYLELTYDNLTEEKKIEVSKKIQAYNLNEEITKRNINLENKIGIKKNFVKPFIEFYKENKHVLGKAENCFNEFKKNHPDLINDSYKSFEKTIYASGFKLKNF